MTIAPGTRIVTRAAPPSGGERSQTGTWHIAALAERGPTDSPRLLVNLGDYDRHFGARVSYGQRDAVEAHFRNGGSAVNMIRIVGPAATVSTVSLPDALAADSIAVDSVGEGAVNLSVEAEDGTDPDTFTLTILLDGEVVEVSPVLASPAEAASWSQGSSYVRVRALGADVPVATAGAEALTGGSDDRAAVTDELRVAALNKIPSGGGPGQVSIPGATTSAAHAGVAAHAAANNRFAILDAPNSAAEADLIASADADRAAMTAEAEERSFFTEGWHLIPGITRGTTRVVPPSAVDSALMAVRDGVTGNPNEPAAGVNGIPQYSLGTVRPEWSDDARARLNDAGVNVFRTVAGAVRLYGYRTLVSPTGTSAAWLNAANARLRMAIHTDADRLAEPFVFSQITSTKIAEYNGVISGMLLGYYNLGALYGASPEEAFVVDTGPTVNTPERIAARQLSAVVGLRMSEFAEVVYMEFVKIPVTESL